MRVLGASLNTQSVVVTDYHPGRVARSASGTAAARVRARVPSAYAAETQLLAPQARLALPQRHRHPPLVCATKEVPLPRELRGASESPWTMLCEDALLAFEVSFFFLTVHARRPSVKRFPVFPLCFMFFFFLFLAGRPSLIYSVYSAGTGVIVIVIVILVAWTFWIWIWMCNAQYVPDGFEISRVFAYTF
jgi:hypothetical protein